jgi:beta propeller repeat protein
MHPTDFWIKPVIILFLLVIVSTWITGIALAGTETLITTNTSGSNQIYPAISGDWIVWADNRNDDGSDYIDIYAYNVVTGTEKRITPTESRANHPSISDNYVVYDDGRNGIDYDIFLANLITGTEWRITDDTLNQRFPSISGNIIVWQDDRSDDSDIYLNGTSPGLETLLTPDTQGTYQKFPVISGSKVIWEDCEDEDCTGGGNVYMWDISTATIDNITPNGAKFFKSDPFPSIAIDNGRIVWYRGNDIYLNDTSKTTPQAEQVVNDNVPEVLKMYPSISGNNVIWVDMRDSGRSNIYLNLTSGPDIRITPADASVFTNDGTQKSLETGSSGLTTGMLLKIFIFTP